MIAVVDDAVRMGILAGQEAGAAGRTERRGDEGVAESDAFAGDAIDVRCFGEGMPGAAEFVPAEVVNQDEDDVGRACGAAAYHAREGGGAGSHPLASGGRSEIFVAVHGLSLEHLSYFAHRGAGFHRAVLCRISYLLGSFCNNCLFPQKRAVFSIGVTPAIHSVRLQLH